MLAAPMRRDAASSTLETVLADRSELYATLRDVASHMSAGPWNLSELRTGVQWWFDEDLVSEWFMERDLNEQERSPQPRIKRSRSRSRTIREHLRHPLRSLRTVLHRHVRRVRIMLRRVERRVVEPPALIDAVFLLGYENVARLLLRRAKEERFVAEHIEDRLGRVRILYTWETPPANRVPEA